MIGVHMKKSTKSLKDPTKEMTVAEETHLKKQAESYKADDAMKGSVSAEIWSEIKDLNIEMFALPSQKVYMHCNPVNIEPSKLYLTTSSSAVLPSLEAALGMKYSVESVDKFLVVSRAVDSALKVKG